MRVCVYVELVYVDDGIIIITSYVSYVAIL